MEKTAKNMEILHYNGHNIRSMAILQKIFYSTMDLCALNLPWKLHCHIDGGISRKTQNTVEKGLKSIKKN